MKTKVTSKQNLEHFKMINRRLSIHKFKNVDAILLGNIYYLCFPLHQGRNFLRLST